MTPVKDNSKDKEKTKHASGPACELAELLAARILQNNPKHKVISEAEIRKWAVEVDRLLRLDGRDFAKARELLEWSQRDSFWRTNILSISKFRARFDQLTLVRARERSGENGKAERHDRGNGIPRDAGADAGRFAGDVERARRWHEKHGPPAA